MWLRIEGICCINGSINNLTHILLICLHNFYKCRTFSIYVIFYILNIKVFIPLLPPLFPRLLLLFSGHFHFLCPRLPQLKHVTSEKKFFICIIVKKLLKVIKYYFAYALVKSTVVSNLRNVAVLQVVLYGCFR